MKRIVVLMFLMTIVTVVTFGQVDTTNVVYTSGDTFSQFLSKNWLGIAFIAWVLISEWLYKTGKVKAGTIPAFVLNLIGKLLGKKSDLIKTRKVEFLDKEEISIEAKKRGFKVTKILLIGILLSCGLIVTAQPKNAFFKPVSKDMFKTETGAKTVVPSIWLLRPSFQITAVQLTWNKETKGFDSSPLSSVGAGVSYQHYVEANGTPFNNYGFNVLVLLGTDITKITPASLSVAGTFNMSVINLGVGYNIGNKVPFILTGVKLDF
jgi:hypothetical protein